MIKDITLGQYYPAESKIHQLDPRVKIVLTMLYIILIFFIQDFLGYGLLLVFNIIILKLSKIPAPFVLKGIKPLFMIIVITALINVFTPMGGDVLFKYMFLTITSGSVYNAIFMVLRIVFLVTGTSFLTYTTSPITLTDGLEKLLDPFKRIGVPSHELAMMMSISLRFIPTLIEETDKIMKAQMARGADFESGSLSRRVKSLIPVLVPLLISAFRRAHDLATAMEARCYQGGENRTRMKQLSYTKGDFVAIIVYILVFIVIFSVEAYL